MMLLGRCSSFQMARMRKPHRKSSWRCLASLLADRIFRLGIFVG